MPTTPDPPPAPATTSPAGVVTGHPLGTPGGAPGPATGGAGAPPGTTTTNTPTSGGSTGGGTNTGGHTMAAWKKIEIALLVLAAIAGLVFGSGYLTKGCSTSPLPAPQPVASAPTPPPPEPTPDPTPPPPPDVRILRVADGEGSTGTYVGPNGQPGGATWPTLSGTFAGKSVLVGEYKGEMIRLGGETLLVLLPPSASNPVAFYTEECAEMRTLRKAPEDRWLREIWARCNLGGERNTAVATTMARSCSVSGCFSREDGASLDARVRKVERAVEDNGNRPVPPQQVGYDPSAPTR